MLNKYSTLILGAMLGLGTLAFSGAGASAAAMLPLAPVASGQANGLNDGIVQVHKKRRHGHFNRPGLFLPLIIGGFGAYNYYDYDDGYGYAGVSSRHVRWCLNRYRSYNPRTNTWVSYSGRVKQCYSPYL